MMRVIRFVRDYFLYISVVVDFWKRFRWIISSLERMLWTSWSSFAKSFGKRYSKRRCDKEVNIRTYTKIFTELASYFSLQVDKLQTNHRGVFVLSDTKFKWLEKYSSDDIESKQAAERMLHFPCGMIRGALANLGVLALVNADFNNLPACTFNIRVKT